MSNQTKVQSQFGTNRALKGYANSDIHARGESLDVLADYITPQANWQALDVATGAGHTALRFAPQVAHVFATDITPGMLKTTAQLAQQAGLSNVETKYADANALPFEDERFDLVTCRLAFHHFPQPQQAGHEFARVLKPKGILGFTDNITVPDPAAAQYYNAYEKLRDPSHHWVNPLADLESMFQAAGLQIEATQKLSKVFEFHKWADRQSVSAEDKEKLLDLMRHIPAALKPLFAPRWADGTMYFSLWEIVIIARKVA